MRGAVLALMLVGLQIVAAHWTPVPNNPQTFVDLASVHAEKFLDPISGASADYFVVRMRIVSGKVSFDSDEAFDCQGHYGGLGQAHYRSASLPMGPRMDPVTAGPDTLMVEAERLVCKRTTT